MELDELSWQASNAYERTGAAFESVVRRKCLIRDSSADGQLGEAEVHVKLVRSAADYAAADQLVAKRYAWRGYLVQSDPSELPTDAALTHFTLLALRNDGAVGTITLGIDGLAGLAADEANHGIIDRLRRIGRRVVELRRFAVEEAGQTRTVFANLFLAAYRIGRLVHRATDVLIEVNPRHEAYYRRIFGFARVGNEWVCPRVNAPAVLMHLDLTNLDARLRSSLRQL